MVIIRARKSVTGDIFNYNGRNGDNSVLLFHSENQNHISLPYTLPPTCSALEETYSTLDGLTPVLGCMHLSQLDTK